MLNKDAIIAWADFSHDGNETFEDWFRYSMLGEHTEEVKQAFDVCIQVPELREPIMNGFRMSYNDHCSDMEQIDYNGFVDEVYHSLVSFAETNRGAKYKPLIDSMQRDLRVPGYFGVFREDSPYYSFPSFRFYVAVDGVDGDEYAVDTSSMWSDWFKYLNDNPLPAYTLRSTEIMQVPLARYASDDKINEDLFGVFKGFELP